MVSNLAGHFSNLASSSGGSIASPISGSTMLSNFAACAVAMMMN
jgi:hypothetical protein